MFEVKNRRQRRLCSRRDKENTEPITESSAPSVENPESAHGVWLTADFWKQRQQQ